MPAKGGIQYAEALNLNRESAAYWIIRPSAQLRTRRMMTVQRTTPTRRYFDLLVNFFTATRNSSVSMASMIPASSASSCCFTGVTAA